MSGTGIDVVPKLSEVSGNGTDVVLIFTEVFGTGIDVVPTLPKYPVPVLKLYRTHRSVWYRVDVVPKLPKCPVPTSMLYRYRYQLRNIRPYRYRKYSCLCRTELTEVSGTGLMLY